MQKLTEAPTTENLVSGTFSNKKQNMLLLNLVVFDRASSFYHFSRSGPFFAAKATVRFGGRVLVDTFAGRGPQQILQHSL